MKRRNPILFGAWILAACCYLASSCSGPQLPVVPQAQKEPTAASVKGRVFLITGAGDLKPARFANVFIIPLAETGTIPGLGEKLAAAKECPPLDRISQLFTRMQQEELLANWRKRFSDLAALFADAATKTNGSSNQSDEEGNFTFDSVIPNSYVVFAVGQAGANLAYWQQSVTTEAGKTASVKLSSPAIACLFN